MADAGERELGFRQFYRANIGPVQAYAVNRVALNEVPDIVLTNACARMPVHLDVSPVP